MQKLIFFIAIFSINIKTLAQSVSINNTGALPSASSMLDVSSNTKGMLVPRMSAIQRTAIAAPANGLLVYDNDSLAFAYFDGASWAFIKGNTNAKNNWNLMGNAGTTADNFIGTIDDKPLRFKVNKVQAGIIDSTLLKTAFGFASLNANTTGIANTSFGYKALYNNTTGFNNVAIGDNALYANTDRDNLVAIGSGALANNGIGATNIFEARYNTAIGNYSLSSNTKGFYNTAIGSSALYNNTLGNGNTATGSSTLQSNITGSGNTAFGSNTLVSNDIGNRNCAFGSQALFSSTKGNDNTSIGDFTLVNNISGSSNVAVGSNALLSNTIVSNLVAVGDSALYKNNLGTENTAVGSKTLFGNISGTSNTASGFNTLYSNATGSLNTALGVRSLYFNLAGSSNTAVGYSSGFNSTSSNNTFIGYSAGINPNNGFNTCIGNNVYSTAANVTNYTGIGYNVGNGSSLSNYVELGNTSVTTIRAQVTGITAYSDKRIKDNVQNNVPGLNFITQLKPVTYNLNIHKQNNILYTKSKPDTANWEGKYDVEKITQTGFLAQDVDATLQKLGIHFSGLVKPKNENDLYTIRYTDFIMPLVKGMQEQQIIIETQQLLLQNLQTQLEEIKKILNNTVKNSNNIKM